MNSHKKRFIAGFLTLTCVFSIGLSNVVQAEQLLDHVTAGKTDGDRFFIDDFNDIWEFIKRVYIGALDQIGIGAEPRDTIDGENVTFDLGSHATASGVLAVDSICSDSSCATVDALIAMEASGGQGQFVGVTDAATYTAINVAGTSSLDSTGKTTGSITYDADGAGAGAEITGYQAANAICKVALSDSSARVCTEDEIVRTIDSNLSAFSSFTTETFGWVSGGGSKYTSGLPVDDCDGFTYDAGSAHVGNIWKIYTDGGAGSAQPCITPTRIACCL